MASWALVGVRFSSYTLLSFYGIHTLDCSDEPIYYTVRKLTYDIDDSQHWQSANDMPVGVSSCQTSNSSTLMSGCKSRIASRIARHVADAGRHGSQQHGRSDKGRAARLPARGCRRFCTRSRSQSRPGRRWPHRIGAEPWRAQSTDRAISA